MTPVLVERRSLLPAWLGRWPRSLLAGLIMLVVAVAVAFIGPWFTADPLELNLSAALRPPSLEHWFGTDNYGRDVFSRVINATRIDLAFGFFSFTLFS